MTHHWLKFYAVSYKTILSETVFVLPEFFELLFHAGDVVDLGPFFYHLLNRVEAGLDEAGGERFLQLQ